ncbi:hypothetical protein AXE76_03620 [Gardnerella vaginalis]|uniref:Peptidase n=1 Tax=Gardnerella vaginalis TaxID=2702 RepID=A0A3E1IQK9_GARVA|nr:hypothetical protein [Gardnerella vaginalis]RFD75281.1 hypothetical protein AXE76_03620 [Gardnerella vaginalis]
MLNKKAIAALAAGATLLSGMAFAAPAFAKDEAPKCTPVAADKLAELKKAVTEAKRAVAKAERDLADAKDTFDEGTDAYTTAKGLVDAYKLAVKNFNDAVDAATAAAGKDNEGAKKDAAKAAAKAVNKAAGEAKKNATFKGVVLADIAENGNATKIASDTTFDEKLNAAKPNKSTISAKKVALEEAKSALEDAKADLAKAECKDVPADPDHKNDQDPTPTPQGKDVQHTLIDKVRFAKMMLDDADDALAHAKATLKDKTAALAAATAELKARTNDLDNAKLRLNEFLASGVSDSATQTRLSDAVDRAEAHVLRATAAFAKANGEYKDALAKAFAAVDAYNKALLDYKAIYNEAVANGVNPALLPPVVTSDPLSKNFPQVPGAKALYDSALSGKFGQEVKKILEEASSKKADAKKADAKKSAAPLAKTGAAVALAAVAASVLAGMGAALRKIRH